MGKPSTGKKGKGRKSQHNKDRHVYDNQRVRTEANKKKRRLKHLEDNPNDEQGKEILVKKFGLRMK